MRSMRDGCTSGTIAASLTRPMRRPLTSSTGMPTSSVKKRRFSDIENALAPDTSERLSGRFSTLVLRCALHGFYRRHFQYGASGGEGATKKKRRDFFLAQRSGDTEIPAGFTLTGMSILFRRVTCLPLRELDAAAPDGVAIGVVGENGAGTSKLLRLAAGREQPEAGTVERSGATRLLGPDDELDLSPVPFLAIDHTVGRYDALARERAAIGLDRLRRGGTTIFVASHEEDLLQRLGDEIWWLQDR